MTRRKLYFRFEMPITVVTDDDNNRAIKVAVLKFKDKVTNRSFNAEDFLTLEEEVELTEAETQAIMSIEESFLDLMGSCAEELDSLISSDDFNPDIMEGRL